MPHRLLKIPESLWTSPNQTPWDWPTVYISVSMAGLSYLDWFPLIFAVPGAVLAGVRLWESRTVRKLTGRWPPKDD